MFVVQINYIPPLGSLDDYEATSEETSRTRISVEKETTPARNFADATCFECTFTAGTN